MIPAVYATIDLEALQHNLQIAKRYAPKARIMAVIKANGYGHGLVRIAEALQQADAFAVARVDEGIRLRKAGISHRILVLEGFTYADEVDEFIHHQLEAVIHTPIQLDILEQRIEQNILGVWLKLDSGMNRLGFKADEFDCAYNRLISCSIIKKPVNLMTHLANADEKSDLTTSRQIDLFNEKVRSYPGQRSIANSAGILGWRDSVTDWIRPGLMLYGVSPFSEAIGAQLELKAVMTLHSRLIAVKSVEKNETVGYGNTWLCQHPTRLGVVAIGYGDGYPRYARAGTPVLINGKRVPIIGRVSMDMITVDLGSQLEAKPGDAAILWGRELPVEEIAEHANTIPYTLVCGVTQRVQIVCR